MGLKIDIKKTICHIEKFLSGDHSIRRLYKWYFAQHLRVAEFDRNARSPADLNNCRKTSQPTEPEDELLNELFDTLDDYRSERDLAMGLTGYTEAEVRRRLKKLVVQLRKCVPTKPPKSRKDAKSSSHG